MEVNTSNMVYLNGINYYNWKCRMKDLLFVKNMHLPVFGSGKPDSKTDEEWMFEHRQVCGFIRMWMDDDVRTLVANETNAKDLWGMLERMYVSKTVKSKLNLMKQLKNLKVEEDNTPIFDHVNEFVGVVNQLSDVGVKFEDEVLGLWLLSTLPDSWETFRVLLMSSAPGGVISFDYVTKEILNEEIRRRI